jgi:hypothetical protein
MGRRSSRRRHPQHRHLILFGFFTLLELMDDGFQGVLQAKTVSLSIPCHDCRPASNAFVKYGPSHLSFRNGSMMYHG